ncbi:class I SAM-dependent methyltransferase [Streptomyces sp. WMMB 322]|uniref:class I SAM-dependent methyltransferase n=1 Tax=Streptomyces sp. WMMB 322 TaxID=1286821 RepID=UPI0006E17084|nr:class I SAM-dependent methyltransferase [Streptomyces sp. WMMB 322]SCK30186.1 Ubiquinone/menaquinone biosynthesis C-methylase UbiE [Streptomyces sp. WMMB 322]
MKTETHELAPEPVGCETAGDERLRELFWTPVGAATADAAQLRMGAHVLALRCGSGATALAAAERTGPVGTVDAVDPSGPLIIRARGEAAARRLSNVDFVQGDVLTWPPRRGGYDSILCAGGTDAFRDPASARERLLQLMRPGGRLTVSVWAETALEPLAETLLQAISLVEAVPGSASWSTAVDSPTGTPASLRDWLAERSLSFPDIRTHRLTLPADPDLLWPLLLRTRLKAVLDGLSPATTACVRRRFAQVLLAGRRDTFDVTVLIGTGTLCRVTSTPRAEDAGPRPGRTRPGDATRPPSPL